MLCVNLFEDVFWHVAFIDSDSADRKQGGEKEGYDTQQESSSKIKPKRWGYLYESDPLVHQNANASMCQILILRSISFLTQQSMPSMAKQRSGICVKNTLHNNTRQFYK